MKRRYKLMVWLATIWALGIFPAWLLIPWPKFWSANMTGGLEAVALVVAFVGSLIWVIWPKSSN